MNNQKRE